MQPKSMTISLFKTLNLMGFSDADVWVRIFFPRLFNTMIKLD